MSCLLRENAPRLSRHFFTCPRPHSKFSTLQQTKSTCSRTSSLNGCSSTSQHFPLTARVARHPNASAATDGIRLYQAQALSGARRTAASASGSGSFFPEENSKSAGYWLLASAASVFGLVVFGGLTRLTESGLSITEWRPVTGSVLPANEEQWESEFHKYRASPEFHLLNPGMTMDEFRKIYYMEWGHRIWGRFVGVSFILPAIYFVARRKVTKSMAFRIGGIGALIGFQGLVGWWMVKSGLKDDLFAPGSHPRVSQYRLVTHLGTAFVCYSAMLWSGLQILREKKLLSNLKATETILVRLRNPGLNILRNSIGAVAGLVFITAMSGGFVAGLDAGLIYNEFPWMGENWVPPSSELLSDFYSQKADGRDLWWRNALENPALAQLDHRVLATTTFTVIVALFSYSRLASRVRKLMPTGSKKAMHGVIGFAFLQVALGISTLLYLVPLPLASAHQAGSLALLSYMLVLGSRTWLPNQRLLDLLAKRVALADPTATKQALHLLQTVGKKNNLIKAFPEVTKFT